MMGSGGGGSEGGEMSVLERQQARMKWQQEHFQRPQLQLQQQQILNYFSGESDQLIGSMLSPPVQAHQFQSLIACDDQNLIELLSPGIKQDPGLENGWSDLGTIGANALGYRTMGFERGSDFEMNYTVSRTTSCPPAAAAAVAVEAISAGKKKEAFLPEKPSSITGRESFKKRKSDKSQSLKAVAEEEIKDKKLKGYQEEGSSKVRTEQTDNKKTTSKSDSKKEPSTDTSKQTSKVTEDKKPDYIHVRARRGQATDSHSLAERVRREKISKRMKYLQDLVPGCNKITGKAGMLDEIINYVQSLQKQVEFLSTKLAAVNPRLDFNIDNLFSKKMLQSSLSNFPPVGITSEMATPSNFDFNLLQVVSSSGLEIGINPSDMALQRTTSASVLRPKTLFNSSGINQGQTSPTWDGELQNLYAMEVRQGRSAPFISQPCMGFVEGINPRMEI